MNLGFIITGNLRTFFTEAVQKNFCKWLTALRERYTIHMVCVINNKFQPEQFKFLSEFCQYTLVSFIPYSHTIRYPSQSFYKTLSKEVDIHKQTQADMEHHVKSFLIQRKQFQIGFKTLQAKGLDIPYYIKSRFDMATEKILIPFSHTSEIFPHCAELEEEHRLMYNKFGIQNMDECIEFQRLLNSSHTEVRIKEDFYKISLGGCYYYNLDINRNPKLWTFNDFIFIGHHDSVKRYAECEELLENPLEYINIIRKKNMRIFLYPEIILWAYLYSIDITPIVCLRDDVFRIIRE
jgi:hypothetical protein